MTNTSTNHLPLSVVSIAGADAVKFLQSQLTCDIAALTPSTGTFGALCNLKGRVVANFIALKRSEDDVLLIIHRDVAPTLEAHFKKYMVFSKATLKHTELSVNLAPYGGSDEPMTVSNEGTVDIVHPSSQFVYRIGSEDTTHNNAWHDTEIATGIVWVDANLTERHLPQVLGLEALNAISYKKGCYIGQEVVARVKYLGKSKQALYRASFAQAPIERGVTDQRQKTVGELIGILGTSSALAILRNDFEAPLMCGDIELVAEPIDNE